eukprot:gene7389-10069_t
MEDISLYVFPGDVVGSSITGIAGIGTYVWENDQTIRASLCGIVKVEPHLYLKSNDANNSEKDRINVICKNGKKAGDFVVKVRDTVVCRVVKCNYNQAFVEILMIADTKLDKMANSVKGLIRKEDVSTTANEKVDMHSLFQLGDIVKANVISLGDNEFYFLSTTEMNN